MEENDSSYYNIATQSSLVQTTMEANGTVQSPTINMLDFWLSGITLLVVIVLGLIGNTLTMIVLTRKSMRSSTNTFLFALAISDSVILLSTALLISFNPLSPEYRNAVAPHVIPYVYPTALTAQTFTIWITVSFTIERYIAVCHPLKATRMCTIKRARTINTGILLASVIYNLPRWFEFQTVTDNNISVYNLTEFGGGTFMTKVYYTALYLPVMTFLPLVLLAVFNTCLIHAVRKSIRERKRMSAVHDPRHRENNVTVMLVAVVFVFMVCQLPALVYNVAYGVDIEAVQISVPHRILSRVRNFMVTLNSAVNILLYCALGQKFRHVFILTFTCCFIRPAKKNCTNSYYGRTDATRQRSNESAYLKVSIQETQMSEAEL